MMCYLDSSSNIQGKGSAMKIRVVFPSWTKGGLKTIVLSTLFNEG